MPEFLELMPPREALVTLIEHLVFRPIPEEIPTEDALDRVTYQPVLAEHPLPSFPRSTVDGYAVRAADTHGASDSLPAYLSLAGEVPMGAEPGFTLSPGKCGLIYTGGMLPSEADAVVMVEHTQSAAEGEVEVLRAVAVGENVLKVGEDVSAARICARRRLAAPWRWESPVWRWHANPGLGFSPVAMRSYRLIRSHYQDRCVTSILTH
jgi:molybdopterin molybdotransferase